MATEITLNMLREDWQRAVREHGEMARDARRRGLNPQEFRQISKAYLLRVDAAFARLKAAEISRAKTAAAVMGRY